MMMMMSLCTIFTWQDEICLFYPASLVRARHACACDNGITMCSVTVEDLVIAMVK